MEWADSALFLNQPLFPLWEHHVIPALAFGYEFLLQLDEAPA